MEPRIKCKTLNNKVYRKKNSRKCPCPWDRENIFRYKTESIIHKIKH